MAGEYDWTLTWTALLNAQAISDSSDHNAGAISNDGKLATEVAIKIAYGATATEGVVVSILREGDTDYEAAGDSPFSFSMPYTASTTHRRTISVPGDIGRFEVLLSNDSGAEVTADVDYRQAVAAS